jgi:hypothetical protein
MSALERADNWRQPVITRAAVGAKPDGFRVVGTAAQAFLRVVNHLKGPARGFEEHFPGGRRPHCSPLAREYRSPGQRFELPELMAKG